MSIDDTARAAPRSLSARPANARNYRRVTFVYRLLREVLEDTPRTTPRVATHLNAHCSKNGREWKGAVLSLSENGCLLRSPEPLLLGSRIDLSFELPKAGAINLRAEVAYQLVPESGLIFLATLPNDRSAISDFVVNSISST